MSRSNRLDGATCGRRRPRRTRRGAVAAQVAVSLVVLLGFTALTVDVGHLYNARAELQRTADAAALAAVLELGGGKSDTLVVQDARQTAANYAATNTVLGEGVVLEQSDIIFGRAYIPKGETLMVFSRCRVPGFGGRSRARGTFGGRQEWGHAVETNRGFLWC